MFDNNIDSTKGIRRRRSELRRHSEREMQKLVERVASIVRRGISMQTETSIIRRESKHSTTTGNTQVQQSVEGS